MGLILHPPSSRGCRERAENKLGQFQLSRAQPSDERDFGPEGWRYSSNNPRAKNRQYFSGVIFLAILLLLVDERLEFAKKSGVKMTPESALVLQQENFC